MVKSKSMFPVMKHSEPNSGNPFFHIKEPANLKNALKSALSPSPATNTKKKSLKEINLAPSFDDTFEDPFAMPNEQSTPKFNRQPTMQELVDSM